MGETPNLTYLISSLETGGAEVGMARLLDGISSETFNVTVVALYGGDQTVVPKIPGHVRVNDLDIEKKYRIDKLSPLVPILRDTDILIGSIYHAEIISRLSRAVIDIDTLLNWAHNTEFKTNFRRQVDKLTIGRCDGILADSEAVATMLIEMQGVDPDKIWTVPPAGLSIDEYARPSIPIKNLDESSIGGKPLENIPEDAVIIGTLGNLINSKNHDIIIELAERLSDQNVHMTIAGDGSRRRELINMISNRGLSNVSLLGYVDSVPEFLSTVDIYFQPSHYEGLCITVIEAMAAGKPVVASNVGEIPANVEHGEHGFITASHDIDGFEKYLCHLSDNPNLRTQMGKVAREKVQNKYSQDALVKNFQAAVNKVHFGK